MYILPYIRQFLANYDDLYPSAPASVLYLPKNTTQDDVNNTSATKGDLKAIYSPKIVSLILSEFGTLIGKDQLKMELPNYSLLQKIATSEFNQSSVYQEKRTTSSDPSQPSASPPTRPLSGLVLTPILQHTNSASNLSTLVDIATVILNIILLTLINTQIQ